MEKRFWVYMLASKKCGTLYIGMTSDLVKRIWEHKHNVVEGFTEKYNVHHLVWFEEYATAEQAIKREKCLKKYNRHQERNPEWACLYNGMCA